MRLVILYNIRSAYNVGSILRTCDAAGIHKVYCVGHTPVPTDRFGRKRKDIAKVALGAEETVEWEYKEDISSLIDILQHQGVQIAAVEQDPDAIDYREFKEESDVAYILGNEVEGISDDVLRKAGVIIEIPMKGEKESLNVSVAAGVVLFQH